MILSQTDLAHWPAGLCEDVAYLSLEPAEISRRSGIRFVAGSDALGPFSAAIVTLGEDRMFALQSHDHAPTPGTKIIAETDFGASVRAAAFLLELAPGELIWIRDDASADFLSAMMQAGPRGVAA